MFKSESNQVLHYLPLSSKCLEKNSNMDVDCESCKKSFWKEWRNTMHLARTYWGIPSESWEIGGQYHPDPRRPQADGGRWYWPPISKDEDGIPQYVRARCMAFTLLLCKLKPHTQLFVLTVKILRFLPVTCITQYASLGGSSRWRVLPNTCRWEAPTGDAYWVIHVTGRVLRFLGVPSYMHP